MRKQVYRLVLVQNFKMPSQTKNIVRSKYPDIKLPNVSLGEFIESKINQVIQDDPNRTFLIDTKTSDRISYSEAKTKALELCYSLVQNGLQRDDVFILLGDNSIDHALCMLGAIFSGVTVMPGCPTFGPFENCKQLIDSGARVLAISKHKLSILEQMADDEEKWQQVCKIKLLIIFDAGSETDFPIARHSKTVPRIVTLTQLLDKGRGQTITVPYFSVENKSKPCMLIYTSGTTAMPKGVIHSHQTYISGIMNYLGSKMMMDNQDSIYSLLLPFGHISGSFFLLTLIANRMTAVLFDIEISAEKYIQLVCEHHCTLVNLLPPLAMQFSKNAAQYRQKYDITSIRTFMTVGYKFPIAVLLRLKQVFQADFKDVYGATETLATVAPMEEYEPGHVGNLRPNTEMKIIDLETGEALPANKEGEICFRSSTCFIHYLNNEEATRKAFDEDGWYHTGDIGFYDEQQRLHLTDRLKELIKFKYWSVGPLEIENFLETHEKVAGAVVVGVKHATEGSHLRAYIKLREDKTGTEQEFANFVRDNLGFFKRLVGGVRFVDKITRTSVGKVDRKFYRKLVEGELLTELAPLN